MMNREERCNNAQFQEHGKRAAASIFRNMKSRKQERSHLFHCGFLCGILNASNSCSYIILL
jgi:hypothetical protein